jgi:hypothetical protein
MRKHKRKRKDITDSERKLRAGLFRLFDNSSIKRPSRGRFRATKAIREAAKESAKGATTTGSAA